jgi:uncharacterized protein YjbI with pentapeptide repeats
VGIKLKSLQKRWSKSQVNEALSALKSGQTFVSPFGRTEEGLEDFRGLAIKDPVTLNATVFESIDLSQAIFSKILCICCNFSNCSFKGAKIMLLNNGSVFKNIDFSSAALSTSGAIGQAGFVDCRFTSTIFTGGNFQEGIFERCDFTNAKLQNIEFGKRGECLTVSLAERLKNVFSVGS